QGGRGVRARAPHLTPGNERAEDGAPSDRGTAVRNGDSGTTCGHRGRLARREDRDGTARELGTECGEVEVSHPLPIVLLRSLLARDTREITRAVEHADEWSDDGP